MKRTVKENKEFVDSKAHLKKINDEEIKPITLTKPTNKVKGYQLFPDPYCNIYICAKKKSGKTNIIWKILHDCIGKDTKVLLFVSTIYKDDNWIKIVEYLDKSGIDHSDFTSLKDEGIDLLETLIKKLSGDGEDDEPGENNDHQNGGSKDIMKPSDPLINFGGFHTFGDPTRKIEGGTGSSIRLPYGQKAGSMPPLIFNQIGSNHEKKDLIKKKRPKLIVPEYLLILDDLANEVKSQSVINLLKKSRHYKFKVVVSSQNLNDLPPGGLLQMDYILLFRGMPEKKLRELFDKTSLDDDYEKFVEKYKYATKDKFNFLYIDVPNSTFRKNFNKEFK